MGQIKMKQKEQKEQQQQQQQQQPTNGTEVQLTTELQPGGPIVETCQKVRSLLIFQYQGRISSHPGGGQVSGYHSSIIAHITT